MSFFEFSRTSLAIGEVTASQALFLNMSLVCLCSKLWTFRGGDASPAGAIASSISPSEYEYEYEYEAENSNLAWT
jgi:hypothetical protein